MEVYHGLERTVALSQHAMTKSGSEAEMNTANGEWAVRLEDHATTNRQLGPLRRLLVCPELCRRYLAPAPSCRRLAPSRARLLPI